MTPLKIGACLKTPEIKNHRDWLFDAARDIELQDFMTHAALTSEFDARISAAKTALDGHTGRCCRDPGGSARHPAPMTWIFMMPYKFNASCRHKFEKKRQKVTNWRVYNEVLRL
jgi:hypothetical protein